MPKGFRAWTYAAKLGSWPKLLVPALFGQALGISLSGRVDGLALLFGLAYSVTMLLYIVFLNDWGDQKVDAIKRKMFPEGCSPKTIPDGILPAPSLLMAGTIFQVLGIGIALLAQELLDRPYLGLRAVGCAAVFLCYTPAPIKLNYRGGGEWLETLGVGALFPYFHFYLQSGEHAGAGLWLLTGHVLLCHSSAIASGLSDEESDRAGGKTTFVTRFGNRAARRRVELSMLSGALLWAIAAALPGLAGGPLSLSPQKIAIALGVAVVLINWRRVRGCSEWAKTNAFAEQGRYKLWLHQGIWRGTALLSLLMILFSLCFGGAELVVGDGRNGQLSIP